MECKFQKRAFLCKVWIISIVILLMSVLSACGGSASTADSVAEMFENRWGFNLPHDMQLEYYESERIWSGDGINYAVFKVKAVPANLIADFSKNKDEEFASTVNGLTDETQYEIPDNLLPDWESKYLWKHMVDHPVGSGHNPTRFFRNIYLIYFLDTLRLIICENLI